MDTVEFLRARLNEDEEAAQAAGGIPWEANQPGRRIHARQWQPGDRWEQPGYIAAFVDHGPLGEACKDHIVRHDPARVLAEVDAKRRIMTRHAPEGSGSHANACKGCGAEGPNDWPVTEDINDCPELRDLAAVYADHPDYQDRWRP